MAELRFGRVDGAACGDDAGALFEEDKLVVFDWIDILSGT